MLIFTFINHFVCAEICIEGEGVISKIINFYSNANYYITNVTTVNRKLSNDYEDSKPTQSKNT